LKISVRQRFLRRRFGIGFTLAERWFQRRRHDHRRGIGVFSFKALTVIRIVSLWSVIVPDVTASTFFNTMRLN
jgi:hypothetical protein